MKKLFVLFSIFISAFANAQDAYKDSLNRFLKEYIDHHEVVKGHDRSRLAFFPVDQKYRIEARYEKMENSPWVKTQTSGLMRPLYRVVGKAHFIVDNKPVSLSVYQSQDLMTNDRYKNYLFIPFTDETSGRTSYAGGRYLDLTSAAIQDGTITLDFNKAYNPYCAYVSNVYSCPIPPKENALAVSIEAGEKAFNSSH